MNEWCEYVASVMNMNTPQTVLITSRRDGVNLGVASYLILYRKAEHAVGGSESGAVHSTRV